MNSHPRATSLATAVAERDREGLSAQLTDAIRLRALLPSGPTEEHGRDGVLAKFDEWFAGDHTIVLADTAGEEVGDRLLVHYRLVFEGDGNRHVLTQTLVCTISDGGLIGRIDLVCSGFRKF
jgi:SnoaL-like protein